VAVPAAAGGGGDGAGPSDPQAGPRWDEEQAKKAAAAEVEDVDVEVLSQQLRGLASPSKPAEKRQKMRDGSSKDRRSNAPPQTTP
jgi:hypothetical protein